MGSQSRDNIEVIDLTDEQNVTITLDDSFVPEVQLIKSQSQRSSQLTRSSISSQRRQISRSPSPQVCPISRSPSPQLCPISRSPSPQLCPISRSPSPQLSLISRSPSPQVCPISRSPTPTFSPHVRSQSHRSSPALTPSPPSTQPNVIASSPSPVKSQKPRSPKSKQAEKELKLKRKQEENLQKEANRANAANKALDNCTANIDENLPKLIGDPEEVCMRTLFDESMVKYLLTDYPKVENSISWTYKRMEVVEESCVPQYKDAPWIIVIMPGDQYLKRLLTYKVTPNDSQSIKSYLNEIRCRSKLNVILFVLDLASHLRGERAKEAKQYRKTFKDKFEGNGLGGLQNEVATTSAIGATELQELRLMLEMEMKHENVGWKMHIEFHEKTTDIVQALVKYTLSIARLEVKLKVKASTGLDWAINMDKERAVDPTKSAEDLTKLWITQLQQFPQVTLPIAKAIAAEYPSPSALLDQYGSLTNSEAKELLAELYVQRNLKRQIGSTISRRVHCFMTCQDPNVHIGLS